MRQDYRISRINHENPVILVQNWLNRLGPVLGLLLVTGLWGEMTIELTSRVGQTGLGTSL